MYSRIMVPVDLEHVSTQEKAVKFAVDLGKLYSAELCLVGVTTSAPSSVAHNEKEFDEKLADFASSKSEEYEIGFDHMTVHSNDPTADLDEVLAHAGDDLGADLIVLASHVPGFMDHFFRSNASQLVTHTAISVMIVR